MKLPNSVSVIREGEGGWANLGLQAEVQVVEFGQYRCLFVTFIEKYFTFVQSYDQSENVLKYNFCAF